ncbi:hypothetical protein LJC36_02475 [Desulfovibrio sp. OttesenSCG-928-C14]|nr:hypothetical protein [Desulfovibrio sp. OttesenSCG-928-C14]
MVRLYLYRFKLVTVGSEHQQSLFESFIDKPTLLKKLILLRPGAMVRKGIEWTMADSEVYAESSIFFNFGRITQKQKDRFDRDERSFYAMIDDDIDRVSCFYDGKFQVLAIESRYEAPKPSTIANYISKVVAAIKDDEELMKKLVPEEKALFLTTRPQIDSITDPVHFIEYIKKAYKINLFEVSFSPENPYDFDELLQNPMQKFMKAADGEESKAGVSSKTGLNKETIVQISHAVAAHGDDARARIFKSENGIAETVRLKKKINEAYIEITEESLKPKERVFQLIKEKYKQIRG